jgi:hypothetical protein
VLGLAAFTFCCCSRRHLQPPVDWTGRITDALDSYRLRQGILDILAEGRVNPPDTRTERIVDFCLGYPQVQSVHLQIIKLEAHDDCEVGYEIRRGCWPGRSTAQRDSPCARRRGRIRVCGSGIAGDGQMWRWPLAGCCHF